MGAATYQEIKEWYIRGLERIELNNEVIRFMVVECDDFSGEDYPVYIKDEKELEERMRNGIKKHEVYDLNLDMDEQLNQRRCWSVPK